MFDWFYMVNTRFGCVGDSVTKVSLRWFFQVCVRFQYHIGSIILPPPTPPPLITQYVRFGCVGGVNIGRHQYSPLVFFKKACFHFQDHTDSINSTLPYASSYTVDSREATGWALAAGCASRNTWPSSTVSFSTEYLARISPFFSFLWQYFNLASVCGTKPFWCPIPIDIEAFSFGFGYHSTRGEGTLLENVKVVLYGTV